MSREWHHLQTVQLECPVFKLYKSKTIVIHDRIR